MLKNVDVITLRDEISFGELESLGVPTDNVTVTADPAYSIIPADGELLKICEENGIDRDEKYFLVSVREWEKNAPDF